MSAPKTSWFHCGRCGSMFQSIAGENDDRVCTSCGRSPSLVTELHVPPSDLPKANLPDPRVAENVGEHEKTSKRRRKRSRIILYLILSWLALIALLIFGTKQLWPEAKEIATITEADKKIAARQMSNEDLALLNESASECYKALTSFLNANTPEQRNQFVLSPIATAAKMARFYAGIPMEKIDPKSLRLVASSVIDLAGKKAIEAQWTTPDDKRFDTIFMKENDEWRLDWDHFVRYSETLWPLYLAGGGSDIGEFRLLARERLPDQRQNEPDISMVLYAPRFAQAKEVGFASPEFLVPRNTESGKRLTAAFLLERNHERPFKAKLAGIDPDGLIRVRAKVRRITEGLETNFVIEEIVACHWYATDELGMDLSASAPQK